MRCLLLLVLCLTSALPAAERLSAEALLDRVLTINRIQEPELDAAKVRGELLGLVDRCRAGLREAVTPRERIAVLNEVLLTSREVGYQSNKYWRDATLTAAVLRGRCNCLAGTVLYVVVGRFCGLPIHMVLVPGHAFARWEDDETRINIETTAGGMETEDERYFARSAISHPNDIRAFRLNRSLDDREFLAELERIAAGHLQSAGDAEAARELMREVVAVFPARDDYRLQLLNIQAEIDHDRAAYRRAIIELFGRSSSPAIRTRILSRLAHEAGAGGEFGRQRELLLRALAEAPKSAVGGVLQALAFCHRSLQDWRGARRYMELAVALVEPGDPGLAGSLYNLAILQKNDDDLDAALASIDRALQINPESWNLQVIKAGYLVLAGRRDEGLALFATVERPRVDADFWNSMQAWFFAVSEQRERFYRAFTHCLEEADTPGTLVWIQQDVDLDVYRDEPRFQQLVEEHRARILGLEPAASP